MWKYVVSMHICDTLDLFSAVASREKRVFGSLS